MLEDDNMVYKLLYSYYKNLLKELVPKHNTSALHK
jgi:hypothetical protein